MSIAGPDREVRTGPSQALNSIVHSRRWRQIALLCLYEAVYYFAYRFGMSFSQASAAPFWFPDAVLLCALLMSPPRLWWLLVLAPLPIRLFSSVAEHIPLWFLLAAATIDAIKGLLAASLLRRFSADAEWMMSVRGFALFCLIAVLLVPAVFAFGGAAIRSNTGNDFWLSWEQWFLGDATAQLIITPAVLYWFGRAGRKVRRPDLAGCIEGGLLIAGLIFACHMAVSGDASSVSFADPRFYAPVPLLFWAGIRFGMPGATGAIAILAVTIVHAAIGGHGPFTGYAPEDTARALQNFLLLRAAPVYLVAVSIEQRKRIERSLRESEERFRNVADTAPMLIWVTDAKRHCVFCNEGWLTFTGHTMAQVLRDGWMLSVHPEDRQYCISRYHTASETRAQFEMEYRLRRHDGNYRWILHRAVPRYDANGEYLGYVGSAIDVTDRKAAEEGARRMIHSQRLAAMGELTATIAHEMRQPLGAILINADAAAMLLRSPHPSLPELREIISDIRQCDLRADELITRIRDFVGNRTTRMEPLDLNEAVSHTLQIVASDARQRQVAVRAELTNGLPLVRGDRTHVQQVLLNLLLNGIDAMEDTLEARRELVVATKACGDGDIEVSVTDRGRGIPEENLPRLFESFFTTRKDGLGLGLSIASSIVTAHQGRIWAQNNPDGGAAFHFTLPTDARRNQLGVSLDY